MLGSLRQTLAVVAVLCVSLAVAAPTSAVATANNSNEVVPATPALVVNQDTPSTAPSGVVDTQTPASVAASTTTTTTTNDRPASTVPSLEATTNSPVDSVPAVLVNAVQKSQEKLSSTPKTKLESGIRVQAFVVSLPSEKDRLKSFNSAWSTAFPELHVGAIQGIKHSMRGRGILLTYLHALEELIDDYKFAKDSAPDFVMFFEDDARPFETGAAWKESLDTLLLQIPKSASVVMLGGHHFKPLETPNKSDQLTPTRIEMAFGAYAWAIRREAMPDLYKVWKKHLNLNIEQHMNEPGYKGPTKYAVDKVWWKLWESKPAYVATPLLVDHPNGWSNTWGKTREDKWAGHRDWWNFDPPGKQSQLGA